MHANTEQLLEIRDGLANDVSSHVASCTQCQAELQGLRVLSQALLDVGNDSARPGVWARILTSAEGLNPWLPDDRANNDSQARGLNLSNSMAGADVPLDLLIADQAAGNNSNHSLFANARSLTAAVYTLAGSIFVTGFFGLYMFQQGDANNQQTQMMQANIQALMLNSRGMERSLQSVSMQSDLLSGPEQSQADRLHWRLARVDRLIQDNNMQSVGAQYASEQVEELWAERIRALTQLNQLYYQRQQTLDDSEI
jgi:hypothetical protein